MASGAHHMVPKHGLEHTTFDTFRKSSGRNQKHTLPSNIRALQHFEQHFEHLQIIFSARDPIHPRICPTSCFAHLGYLAAYNPCGSSKDQLEEIWNDSLKIANNIQ